MGDKQTAKTFVCIIMCIKAKNYCMWKEVVINALNSVFLLKLPRHLRPFLHILGENIWMCIDVTNRPDL